jgi:hypothetical protein
MAAATGVIEEIQSSGAGTWGGVAVDWFYQERLWAFGDFGAASKVLISEDWGDNFTDVTNPAWGAGEVVRPVMPNVYDPDEVVAILNTALECWQSSNLGVAWASNGAIPFACECATRDWIEPFNLFLGRTGVGAAHLQYSHNLGVSWLERSGGFTANAPVTSIVITG